MLELAEIRTFGFQSLDSISEFGKLAVSGAEDATVCRISCEEQENLVIAQQILGVRQTQFGNAGEDSFEALLFSGSEAVLQ